VRILLPCALLFSLAACSDQPAPSTQAPPAPDAAAAEEATELVVYTSRNEQLVRPLFDLYTEETGVRVTWLTDKAPPLMERLKAEGSRSRADVFITVDAGNLWQAVQMGLLAPLGSPVVEANIPENLRDPDGRWTGLSVRARTIVHDTRHVQPSALSTYEDLAGPEWKGRLCLRTSDSVYNQSLVATLIAALGAERAEQVVRGWVDNLAAPPFASDNEVIEAIAAERCAVGIVNTYYLARLQRDRPDLPVAVFWPDQGEGQRGVHVNVSGAGIAAHSRQPQAARAFIEWLSAGRAQELFASENLEFPANPDVATAPQVAGWGPFRPDLINVSQAGALQAEAVKLMDRAGYR
jgi:iron(III) transport system substrate-binding protein